MRRLRQEVVNKDTAMFLREHGHDEYCDCYLHTDNDMQDDYEMWAHNQYCNSDLPDYVERIAAPYATDALLWLMQNMGVDFSCRKTETKSLVYYQCFLSFQTEKGPVMTCTGKAVDFQTALNNALDVLIGSAEFVKLHENDR